ncbi:MAG: hypothetical protein GY858_08445 [Candidatus Omnitrophica bacterium]|nr:hypothetical protein [Candidatus Omnitrophota bacterium]
MDSPLLFPVRIKGKALLVLDETLIPFKEEYIDVKNLDDALFVLGQMKTRALGQVLLFFYSCVFFHKEGTVDDICKRFSALRPTFDFPMMAEMIKYQIGNGFTVSDAAFGFVKMFDNARRKRASYLASILPTPANILTICNVNGELIYLYQELERLGKAGTFYVCETRPYLQGSRLTFWELQRNKIPTKVLCDNQAAVVMKKGLVNCVISGADRAAASGGIINKLGTYSLACLAKHFGIAFYPLTQYPRDIDINNVVIEERPKKETFMFLGGDFSSIDAVYPSFDVTDGEFVTESVKLPV